MSNLRIVWAIPSDTATLSASPALVSTLPVTNLQDPTRARIARTTSLAQQQILGNLTSLQIVNSLVLWRHNLSATATWKLELFSGANQSGTTVYDSTSLAVQLKSLGDLEWGVDALGATVFSDWSLAYSVLWFDAVGAASFRLTLTDPNNTSAYMEASRLMLGRYFSPAVNADYGLGLSWVDESTQIRTAGGTLRTDAGVVYRQIAFDLSALSESERPKFIEIMRLSGKRKDLFVSVFPEAGGEKERDYAFVAKITNNHDNVTINHGYYQDTITLEES
tara:strand:+ start:28 stop:861 length:834 start_codon:yes stop_codon:yes gene_type:complete